MEIAIIGAGFAGLATAWNLVKRGHTITLFDKRGPGGGASGIAAGLLHTYAGIHAKKNWKGEEALKEATDLLEISSNTLHKPVFERTGMLRIAMKKQQLIDFKTCAEKHSDVRWCDPPKCQSLAPGISNHPGIFISSALTVYPTRYIEGLRKAIGAELIRKEVKELSELDTFDHIVICTGAETTLFNAPIKPIKGQLLHLSWPKNVAPLKFPLNSRIYIVMHSDNKSCFVGATFERNFTSNVVDRPYAEKELLPMAYELFPPLQSSKVIDCMVGIRGARADHKPAIEKINERITLFSGLGSKGLLYHALFAKMLSHTL